MSSEVQPQASTESEVQHSPAPKRPQGNKGKGLGVAALVLGILSVPPAFLPLINVLSFPLAAVGLILGVVSLILARGGKGPKGLGIAGTVLSAVALVVTIVMYGSAAAVSSDPAIKDAVSNAAQSVQQSTQGSDQDDEKNEAQGSAAFFPQDVSDETIEKIETYNDYLAMYQKIVDDYLTNYEDAIRGTMLYNEESFAQTKQQYQQSFESQKEMYGKMGDMKIVGKDSLVKFLKDYRDNLKEMTDNLKATL